MLLRRSKLRVGSDICTYRALNKTVLEVKKTYQQNDLLRLAPKIPLLLDFPEKLILIKIISH